MEVSYDSFRVTERPSAGPQKIVLREKGAFARWVSAREIAFVSGNQATKLDVTAPKTRSSGIKTCKERGVSFGCNPDRPPIVVFIAADLRQAIVIDSMLSPNLARVSDAGVTPLWDTADDLGRTNRAVAASEAGVACSVRGPGSAQCVASGW